MRLASLCITLSFTTVMLCAKDDLDHQKVKTHVKSDDLEFLFTNPQQAAKATQRELVERAHLGVYRYGGHAVSPVMKDHLNINSGWVIGGVKLDSPAAKAGLKKYDIILSVNKKPINHFNDVVQILSELKPDDVVSLDVIQSGKAATLQVTLGVQVSLANTLRRMSSIGLQKQLVHANTVNKAHRKNGPAPGAVSQASSIDGSGQRNQNVQDLVFQDWNTAGNLFKQLAKTPSSKNLEDSDTENKKQPSMTLTWGWTHENLPKVFEIGLENAILLSRKTNSGRIFMYIHKEKKEPVISIFDGWGQHILKSGDFNDVKKLKGNWSKDVTDILNDYNKIKQQVIKMD